MHGLGPLVDVLDPVVAGRGSYVEDGEEHGHVNGGDKAQLELAEFGHEHHFRACERLVSVAFEQCFFVTRSTRVSKNKRPIIVVKG